MEYYTDEPESGKPEESASAETRAIKNAREHANRAPVHDVFSRRDLKWRREGADDVLYTGKRRLLRLLPDATYPNMWRVVYPDGELGDLKNLTWARHEGARVALSLLNKQTAPGTSQRSPLTPAGARSVSVTPANGDARQSPSKKAAAAPGARAGGSMKQDRNHARD
jgi:hypothetical protein